ncbi:MAG: hypothetical protein PHC50_03340 [Candidatus Cloacimonetes bacterium]|nr:hypothetical protein [Candidatus Cloacimonadota bacterium]
MPQITLPYTKLREILGAIIAAEPIRTSFADLLSGSLNLTEIQLIDLIYQSQIDARIIEILGQDPESIDAIAGLELILSFFAYMKANASKFSDWLSNIASPAAAPKNRKTN